MKKFILLGLITSTFAFGGVNRKTYMCVKGTKHIYYRIAYKNPDSPVPCKVYEKYTDKQTRRIAYSEKTPNICEAALNKTMDRLQQQGMPCIVVEDPTEATPAPLPNTETATPTPTPSPT
jgi:type III secretory pathway component EscU